MPDNDAPPGFEQVAAGTHTVGGIAKRLAGVQAGTPRCPSSAFAALLSSLV